MEYLREIAKAVADNPALIIPVGVFVFSVIAKFTPTKSDDMLADRLWGIIHTVALNPRSDRARQAKRDDGRR
jgi:predicted polyphosphate/ATP-dependent NAD kinase